MSLRTMLDDEIKEQIQVLSKLEVGSEAYKIAVDGLTKLLDKANEMDKLELEYRDRYEAREAEAAMKNDELMMRYQELKAEKRNNLAKNGITVGTAALGAGVTIWGAINAWNYDKEGHLVSTDVGRKFINMLFPKK